jgi:hypothetical protein
MAHMLYGNLNTLIELVIENEISTFIDENNGKCLLIDFNLNVVKGRPELYMLIVSIPHRSIYQKIGEYKWRKVKPANTYSLAVINTAFSNNLNVFSKWINAGMHEESFWGLKPVKKNLGVQADVPDIFKEFYIGEDMTIPISLYSSRGGSMVYPLNYELVQRYLLFGQYNLVVLGKDGVEFESEGRDETITVICDGNGYKRLTES